MTKYFSSVETKNLQIPAKCTKYTPEQQLNAQHAEDAVVQLMPTNFQYGDCQKLDQTHNTLSVILPNDVPDLVH